MTLFLCLYLVWSISVVACIATFIKRNIGPNALTLFILLCPAVNTIYAICRSKGFFRTIKEFLFDGIKETWKKL